MASSESHSEFDDGGNYNFANLLNSQNIDDDEDELRLPSISQLEDKVLTENISKSVAESPSSNKMNYMITPKTKVTPSYYPSPSNVTKKKFAFINQMKYGSRQSFTVSTQKLSTEVTRKQTAEVFDSQI